MTAVKIVSNSAHSLRTLAEAALICEVNAQTAEPLNQIAKRLGKVEKVLGLLRVKAEVLGRKEFLDLLDTDIPE